MAASTGDVPLLEVRKKPIVPLISSLESQEWISEEELYTEGSSDEDDMALRMRRRERREDKKNNADQLKCNVAPQTASATNQSSFKRGVKDENLENLETLVDNDSHSWRPTQGSSKLRHHNSDVYPTTTAHNGEVPLSSGGSEMTLSEAYSSMHRLDALLRESDKKVKVAQEETLRVQLATRSQLQRLRDQVGPHNIALSRNWDAFMRLCPASPSIGKQRQHHSGEGDGEEDSILPEISVSPGEDSEHGGASRLQTELAITDEEKVRLTTLLHELERAEDDPSDAQGYAFDEAARQCLEDIDHKLLELKAGLSEGDLTTTPTPGGVSAGATRKQRLEDIDRCLAALAASALEDVEPVGDDEVQRLLELDGVVAGDRDVLGDSSVLEDLLSEARRELPRFQFRHGAASRGAEV